MNKAKTSLPYPLSKPACMQDTVTQHNRIRASLLCMHTCIQALTRPAERGNSSKPSERARWFALFSTLSSSGQNCEFA